MNCYTVQSYETRGAIVGDANLDLVDAAARSEVDGARRAGAVDLTSGETDEKRQIRRTRAAGFRVYEVPVPRLRGGGRDCRSRAYLHGRRGGWAGGCRASGLRAGPAGRTPSAGSAPPAPSTACFPPSAAKNPRVHLAVSRFPLLPEPLILALVGSCAQ